MSEHWFWFLIVVAVMIWYLTVTVYVSIKGISDIRNMLKRLSER
jgi:hypothetical protein